MNLGINVFRLLPYIANTPADLIYLIGHDDITAFGSNNTGMVTSKAGAAAGSALNQVMDCSGGLYSGNTVHVPAAQ
jgi:hypothetical protein